MPPSAFHVFQHIPPSPSRPSARLKGRIEGPALGIGAQEGDGSRSLGSRRIWLKIAGKCQDLQICRRKNILWHSRPDIMPNIMPDLIWNKAYSRTIKDSRSLKAFIQKMAEAESQSLLFWGEAWPKGIKTYQNLQAKGIEKKCDKKRMPLGSANFECLVWLIHMNEPPTSSKTRK